MTEFPLQIAIIWHMHQPFYKELKTEEYLLPWVRLHAIKDYYDMVSILKDFPEIRLTYNLVPSLLEQIEDYSAGRAKDYYLELSLKKPEILTLKEKVFILRNFFLANRENMIQPYPRYNELLRKRGRDTQDEKLEEIQRYFSEQDFLDLQVWFNLSWFDTIFKEKDRFLKHLIEKDRYYSEEDRFKLIHKQFEVMSMIIKIYRDMALSGQIELITSPFYHPILPLICDTSVAREALPDITLPEAKFYAPEDASEQVRRAVEYFQQLFGFPPRGMWPSEGSVSPEAISIINQQGIRWLVTDEEILARTLDVKLLRDKDNNIQNPEILYQAYRYLPENSEREVSILFRDRFLSDLIGFVYSSWDAQQAADDMVLRLERIQKKLQQRNCRGIVSIVLDGENAWEYYARDGYDFLKALYTGLSKKSNLKTCTITQYLEKNSQPKPLSRMFSGSWINHNFKIWIGHPEDNRAWNYLRATRDTLILREKMGNMEEEKIEAAWKALYIAEGSDWFWWFGDDHQSQDREVFDYLYRRLLIYVYNCLGETVPDYLYKPIISNYEDKSFHKEPKSFIWPEIDGEVSSYFDWYGAGVIQLEGPSSAMYRSESFFKEMYYGFNLNSFHIRLDVVSDRRLIDLADSVINLFIVADDSFNIRIGLPWADGKLVPRMEFFKIEGDYWQRRESPLISVAAKEILEIAIPLQILDVKPNREIRIHFVLEKNGHLMERQPDRDFFYIRVPDKDFEQLMWQV